MTTPKSSRREFIAGSSKIAAAGAVALSGPKLYGYHNSVADTLKIGLVGCGGRGTGAVINATSADENSKVTAVADAFSDRIDSCVEVLNKQIPHRLQIPDENRFDGFDCFQKLVDSGVDVVILATPPHFRPAQLRACVEAGKHVFCEKPVGVDVPGVKSVLESCELAEKKGLSVVSGLCWRYDLGVNAVMDKIKNGAIGDIKAIQVNYLTGTLWHRGENPKWSQMEYQLRNWLYFNWLSGDHIAEQHIHSIDKALWLMGDEPPESCYGMGGRLVRTNPKWGNVYDHFTTVFEWADGRRAFSNCRQMAGCFNNVDDYVYGTDGRAQILRFQIENSDGKWKYDAKKDIGRKKPSMYDVEHKELFKSIREGKPINNGKYMSYSTLMALMGRDASYTGKKIKWKDYMQSETRLGPKEYKWGDFEPAPVAKPGDGF